MIRSQQPSGAGALRRALLVRHGEVLARGRGRLYAGGPFVSSGPGTGVHFDPQARTWTVATPGFGYLEPDEKGDLRVLPAVRISDGALRAELHLRPATVTERDLTRTELDSALAAAGVVHGIRTDHVDAVWALYQKRGDSDGPVPVAFGTPPGPGRDAGVHVEPSLLGSDEAPTDFQTVDHRELGLVTNVGAGQFLGFWLPAGPGEPGRGVDGSRIEAPIGRDTPLQEMDRVDAYPQGDDEYTLHAAEDGMLQIQSARRIAVARALEVEGDVDYDVGNVQAEGCVKVAGSVRDEFRVLATEDLKVLGDVEYAVVETGGVANVEGGVFGDERGHIHAGKRLALTFGQNARLACGGDVVIRESDTRSTIECAGKIIARKGRGRLVGGRYHAGEGITCLELGSAMEAETVLIAGAPGRLARRLRRECPDAAELEPDPRVAERGPRVEVRGTVHPGVVVEIHGARFRVTRPARRVVFRYDPVADEVVMDVRG